MFRNTSAKLYVWTRWTCSSNSVVLIVDAAAYGQWTETEKLSMPARHLRLSECGGMGVSLPGIGGKQAEWLMYALGDPAC